METKSSAVVPVPSFNGFSWSVTIDAEDAVRVMRRNWRVEDDENGNKRVVSFDQHSRSVFGWTALETLIMKARFSDESWERVDPTVLDYRKSNLRRVEGVCRGNRFARDVPPRSEDGVSDEGKRYRGTTYQRKTGRWVAQIAIDGKTHSIGSFSSEEDAARAYDEVAKVIVGPPRKLNFPDE